MSFGGTVSISNDRSNASGLDDESEYDLEGTDSLPILPAQRAAAAQASEHRESSAANSDIAENLDWLVNLATTIDKRLERIEASIRKLQNRLPKKQEELGIRDKIVGFLSRRRTR